MSYVWIHAVVEVKSQFRVDFLDGEGRGGCGWAGLRPRLGVGRNESTCDVLH